MQCISAYLLRRTQPILNALARSIVDESTTFSAHHLVVYTRFGWLRRWTRAASTVQLRSVSSYSKCCCRFFQLTLALWVLLVTVSNRVFSVAAAKLWNKLNDDTTTSKLRTALHRQLKYFYFINITVLSLNKQLWPNWLIDWLLTAHQHRKTISAKKRCYIRYDQHS